MLTLLAFTAAVWLTTRGTDPVLTRAHHEAPSARVVSVTAEREARTPQDSYSKTRAMPASR